MKQIMDLTLSQQRSHSESLPKDDCARSNETRTEEEKEKLSALRRKTNAQLIEAIRMDSKMMSLRFSDFLTKENNIYTKFAKERERNQMLQDELRRYESAGAYTPESGRAGHSEERAAAQDG